MKTDICRLAAPHTHAEVAATAAEKWCIPSSSPQYPPHRPVISCGISVWDLKNFFSAFSGFPISLGFPQVGCESKSFFMQRCNNIVRNEIACPFSIGIVIFFTSRSCWRCKPQLNAIQLKYRRHAIAPVGRQCPASTATMTAPIRDHSFRNNQFMHLDF